MEYKPISVKKCGCGHPACKKYGLSSGTFYTGCGWDEETARRLANCWNACLHLSDEVVATRANNVLED